MQIEHIAKDFAHVIIEQFTQDGQAQGDKDLATVARSIGRTDEVFRVTIGGDVINEVANDQIYHLAFWFATVTVIMVMDSFNNTAG